MGNDSATRDAVEKHSTARLHEQRDELAAAFASSGPIRRFHVGDLLDEDLVCMVQPRLFRPGIGKRSHVYDTDREPPRGAY